MKIELNSFLISNHLANKKLTLADHSFWALILKHWLLPLSYHAKSKNLKLLCFAALFSLTINLNAQNRFWVASSPGNWNDAANWSTTSGGAGGASVPEAANTAFFNANGLGNCNLDITPTVAGITVNGYTATIDLLGNTLSTTGNNTLASGTISNTGGPASLNFSASANTTFSGTLINADVTGTTARLFLNGSIFNGTVNITKTDSNSDSSTGNNVFNGLTTITNLGAGWILLGNGNPDQFNAATTFNNNGSYRFYFAHNHAGQTTTFASDLTLNTNKSGGTDQWSFLIAESANTNLSFAGNLTINCAGTLQSNHRILQGAGTTLTLAGNLLINTTNNNASTLITMGVNGVSTYNGNINLTNTGGSAGVNFNSSASASATQVAGGSFAIAGGFTSGSLIIQRFTKAGIAPVNLTLGGATTTLRVGPNTSFGGDADLRAPQLFLDGVTITGTAYLEKTGTTNNTGIGNNIFGSTTTIVNNGSGFLRTNGNNTFNGATSLTNNSNGDILLELVSGSTYNGSLTLLNTNTSNIRMAYAGASTFNGNIIVNSTGGTGIVFCETGAATATLSGGNSISIGGSGFAVGSLSLPRFTQTDATAQNLNLTGNSTLIVGPGSSFDGDVTFTSPRLFLNGCTYNGTATLEKTGGGNDSGTGGNIFQQTATITNSGSAFLLTGNTNRDQFFSTTSFNNTGSGRIHFAQNHGGQTTTFASDVSLISNKSGAVDQWSFLFGEGTNTAVTFGGNLTIQNGGSFRSDHRFLNGAGSSAAYAGVVTINVSNSAAATNVAMGQNGTSTYNDNIIVSNTGGSAGITFNASAAASSTVNGTISIAGGYTSGSLNLYRFNQVGALPLSLTLTNTSILRVGPNSEFDGDVNFIAPGLLLNGATYNGVTSLEKNGAGVNDGIGNNIFNNITSIINSGSARLRSGNTSADIFNAELTLTNSGSSNIEMNRNATGTYDGNVIVNSISGTGISFGVGAGGNATLGDGFTLSVGGLGFNTGTLQLQTFTQVGNTPQNILLTGSAIFQVGPLSAFNGDVNFVAPGLLLNGATYNGITSLEKNGAGVNDGIGNNIFNNITSIINSGSARLRSGNTSADIFNAELTLTNSGSSNIEMNRNATGTYDGNVIVNSISGTGISFGVGAGGNATLGDGFTLSVGGLGFNTGTLQLQTFTQVGNTPQNILLTGSAIFQVGSLTEFNGATNFVAPGVLLNGATFNANAYIEKTGAGNNDGTGGNVFNGLTTLVNSGDSYLRTGINNPDIFNDDLIVINEGASTVRLADNSAGNEFNGNIELNSTFGGGIFFGNSAGGSSTLAATRTISVGSLGVISGDVLLRRFTQVGPTDQALNLTGIAALTLGPQTSFGGNVSFIAPQLNLNGFTIDGTAYLEKTGAGNNDGTGGNIFNGISEIVNSGSGRLSSANTNPDIFETDVTVSSTGSNLTVLARASVGNEFKGNITFNSTLGSSGVYIASQAGATASLASGGSLLVGGLGFSSGLLSLRRFTQMGAEAQSLVLTGTGLLELGPDASFNGDVNFQAPQFLLNGTIFNGPTYIEKTGAVLNDSNGGNIFNGPTTIVNSGSGIFRNGISGLDQFNNTLTLTNTGSSSIRLADNIAGTVFNGNIIVNNTSGEGIFFGDRAGGTATLADGLTITVGGLGFSAGELRIRRFTQVGSTAQSLNLSGSAILRVGSNSVFNADVTFSAPRLYLDGATYHGITALTKSGAINDVSTGGNTFNNVTSLTNTGSGYLLSANNNPDIFNAPLTVTNSGSNIIYLAHNVGGNQFNNNVILNATSGGGIFFSNIGTGNSTLAIGYSIGIGGSGFSSGELRIRRVTQQSITAQTLNLTGTALLEVVNSQFNGNVTFTAPQVTLQTNTFNGTATITKTGAGNNDSAGGNEFNGIATISNSGTARFRLSNTTGDTFNNDVTFARSGSGSLDPAFNGDSFFSANVTVNSTADIIFGAGTGRANFTGSINQTINRTNVSAPVFRRLTINKTGGIVTLNTPISISVDATFTSGILVTDVTNIPNFLAGSDVSGASTISHIDGPLLKTGNTAFTFPTGNNGIYRPASISAPGVVSHQFRAQYFFAPQAFGGNLDPTFTSLSGCEYWTVDRTIGTSNVLVTLGWNSADCIGPYISSLPEVRVARWTGAVWENLGNGGTTGDTDIGTVVTSAAVTSFSPFTIATAAVDGDYRSAATGNWSQLNRWQRWNGTDWVTPTVGQGVPSAASGSIEIRTGHDITVNGNITADQITVNGTLTIGSTNTLTAGPAPSFVVVNSIGTINNDSGDFSGSTSANTFFLTNSTYIHKSTNTNGGVVPTATWNLTSNLEIELEGNRHYQLTSSSWSQSFGNVNINISTSGGPKTHQLNGLLNTIEGNLTVTSIGGNANHELALANAGTNIINVGGSFIFDLPNANRIFKLNDGDGTTTLNISGNCTLTRGTFTSLGVGNMVFNGSAVQNFSRAAANNSITGNVNCVIPASSIVDFGTSAFVGAGTFSLTGEMRMAHLLGLDDAVQNAGAKTFNANSTITYNGATNQVMGTLYPATPAAGINVVVNKSAGTLSTSLASTIVSGDLRLLAGNMEISTVAPADNTLTLNGDIVIGSGLLIGNTEAILSIGGTGSVDPINFAPASNTLKRLNINRAATDVGFGGDFILTQALDISAGTLLASSHTIQMLGQTWSVNGSSGGFVNAGTSTVIFDGTTDVVFGCDFHNINLLAARSLEFPSDEVNVSGDINFNVTAVFTPNEGTINFMGGLTQNINADGHTFYNMAVDKTLGAVQINEQLNLTSFLNINSATAVISNGNLILKSNNELLVNVNNSTSLDGKIGPILNGGSVVGDVIVERHIIALPTGGNRLPYRYISSPVLDATWAGGSLLKYNIVSVAATIPEIVYNVGSGGWKSHNIAGGLQNGEGYRLRAPDATDLVFTGEIATGEITWTFTNTNGAWFMIGNPYPSAIAWLNDVGSTRWEADNVSTVIGIYDNFSEGYPNYFRYAFMEIPMDGIPLDQWGILAEQNVIATSQAFWVYVGAGGGSLTIKENAKVAPSEVGRFYKKDNSRISTDLVIALSNPDGRDIAILSSPAVDKNQSVQRFANLPKLWNEEMNVYLLDDSQEALLRYEFVEQEEIRIPVGIEIAKPGIYTISFKNVENFNFDEKLYLIDRYDGNSVELSSTSSYTFRIHLASQVINDRFYLSTNPVADRMEEVVIDVYPNPVTEVLNLRTQGSNETAQSDLFDMNGKKIDSASWKGEHTIQMTNYPAGVYILKVRTMRGVVNKRIFKQ